MPIRSLSPPSEASVPEQIRRAEAAVVERREVARKANNKIRGKEAICHSERVRLRSAKEKAERTAKLADDRAAEAAKLRDQAGDLRRAAGILPAGTPPPS